MSMQPLKDYPLLRRQRCLDLEEHEGSLKNARTQKEDHVGAGLHTFRHHFLFFGIVAVVVSLVCNPLAGWLPKKKKKKKVFGS